MQHWYLGYSLTPERRRHRLPRDKRGLCLSLAGVAGVGLPCHPSRRGWALCLRLTEEARHPTRKGQALKSFVAGGDRLDGMELHLGTGAPGRCSSQVRERS